MKTVRRWLRRKDGIRQRYHFSVRRPRRRPLKRKKAARFYRHSLVQMFFAEAITRATPTPFAEFRVWMVAASLRSQKKRMASVLKTMLPAFPTLKHTLRRGSIWAEIKGYEQERITPDERKAMFATTGWKKGKDNRAYRYAAFFDPKGGIRKDYNDRQISQFIKSWIMRLRAKEKTKRKKHA